MDYEKRSVSRSSTAICPVGCLSGSLTASIAEPAANKTHTSSAFYRPELDSLRFGAFLMVFVHHFLPHESAKYSTFTSSLILQSILADFASAMGAGLPLFFLLSAYLITTLLLQEQERSGTVNIRAFYLRRMLRIWPLYLSTLGLSFLAARLVASDHRVGFFLSFLFMIGNWAPALHLSVNTPLQIGHLWSISVEEQFYLFFPIVAKWTRRRGLLWVAAGITLVAFCTLGFAGYYQVARELIWLNSFVQFLMFASGITIGALLLKDELPQLSTLQRLPLIIAAFSILLINQHYFGVTGQSGNLSSVKLLCGYALIALSCSLILLSVLGWKRRWPKSVTYLGKISYGLYIFHAWGLNLASFLLRSYPGTSAKLLLAKDVLALIVTVIMAMISYKLLETPFLRLKDRFTIVSSRPV